MPQMSPLSWLTLSTFFNTILAICLIKIWFSNTMNLCTHKNNLPDSCYKQLLWKW